MKRKETTDRVNNSEYGNTSRPISPKSRGIASSRLILVVTQQPDSAAPWTDKTTHSAQRRHRKEE